MLLQQKQKKAMEELRNNGLDGIYVPKERRIEQKVAFCGAHFSLGDQSQSKSGRLDASLLIIALT